MGRAVTLGGLAVSLVLLGVVGAYGQADDVQAREQSYYGRMTLLRDHIAPGWTPAQVAAVMGEPDRAGRFEDGPDVVEVWGYRGYEVVVEFRNGVVANWFIRFMR